MLRPFGVRQKLPDRQEGDDEDDPEQEGLVGLLHACLEPRESIMPPDLFSVDEGERTAEKPFNGG